LIRFHEVPGLFENFLLSLAFSKNLKVKKAPPKKISDKSKKKMTARNTEPIFDISEILGVEKAFMDLYARVTTTLKPEWDEDFIIPEDRTGKGKFVYCTDELWDYDPIEEDRLLLMYCFPLTLPPNDLHWKDRTYTRTGPGLRGLRWDPLPEKNPLKFVNGASHRADSKTKEKYISKEGIYYRLRIKKANFSSKYSTLKAAIEKRAEILLS
jgi:hypothetical protein